MISRQARRRSIIFAFSLLGSGVASSLLVGCKNRKPGFNSIDITGATYCHDFQLRDPIGNQKTLQDFRGKYVMVIFGFTQCPDICPTALARAAILMQKLGTDAEHLQVIFITIDPERDNPALLKEYTAQFNPSFLGLSTDLKHTKEVADEFRVYYDKVASGSSYTMDHSTISYLFDPSGKVRLAMRHEHTADQYLSDIRQLMTQRS